MTEARAHGVPQRGCSRPPTSHVAMHAALWRCFVRCVSLTSRPNFRSSAAAMIHDDCANQLLSICCPLSKWLQSADGCSVFRYVPKNWGHAILNTRTSIGFAGEFRIVKSLPSPSDIQGGYSWIGKDAQRSLMLMSEGFSSRTKLHKHYLSLES